MAEPITFVVSTEEVNSYGTWVKTNGIDLTRFKPNPIMLWMHERDDSRNSSEFLPIGYWDNIRIDAENRLLMDANFSEANEKAQTLRKMVEEGTIRTASIGINIIELSEAPEHVKQGQTRFAITRSELVEVSIVDIPANQNAVRLYDGMNIKKLNKKNQFSMEDVKLLSDKQPDKSLLKQFGEMFGLKTKEERIAEESVQLSTEISALKAEKETISAQLTALKSENEALKTENTELKAASEEAETQISELKAQNVALLNAPGAPAAKIKTSQDGTPADGPVTSKTMSFADKLNKVKEAYFG